MANSVSIEPFLEIVIVKMRCLCCLVETALLGKPDR